MKVNNDKNNDKYNNDADANEPTKKTEPVKTGYQSPKLVEYGYVGILTQKMVKGSFVDMMGGFMMLP